MNATKQHPGGEVTLTLTYAEAVVLSDMLFRWGERDGTQERLPFEDQAGQRIVWDLTALFEPLIDEVFDSNGHEGAVSHSRRQVRDSNTR